MLGCLAVGFKNDVCIASPKLDTLVDSEFLGLRLKHIL